MNMNNSGIPFNQANQGHGDYDENIPV